MRNSNLDAPRAESSFDRRPGEVRVPRLQVREGPRAVPSSSMSASTATPCGSPSSNWPNCPYHGTQCQYALAQHLRRGRVASGGNRSDSLNSSQGGCPSGQPQPGVLQPRRHHLRALPHHLRGGHPVPHLGDAEVARVHRQGICAGRRAPQESRRALRLLRGTDAAHTGYSHLGAGFYQKITDIYATSIDYDPTTETSPTFFKTVQNKVHWAITGQTAAEIIHARADGGQPNIGLTSWRGAKPRKDDAHLVFAEGQAMRRIPMHMAGWVAKLDGFLLLNERDILTRAGRISHETGVIHATQEYDAFHRQRLAEKAERPDEFDLAMAVLPVAKAARKRNRRQP